MPDLYPVDSTSLRAIGYDLARQELYVEFLESGERYAYEHVPSSVHQEMLDAASKGTFLNERVKGHYRYRKL